MNLLLQLEVEVEHFRKNLDRCISNNLPYAEIIHEAERLKAQLKDCYFQPGSKLEFRKFTEFHLIKLSELLETIREAPSAMAAQSDPSAQLHWEEIIPDILVVYHKLRALLAFVYEVFGKYLPKDHYIPEVSQQLFIKEVLGNKEEIRKRLQHSDSQLTSLLLQPFVDFVHHKELRTWHQINYCRALYLEFQEFGPEEPTKSREEIIRFLVKLNYNSPDYYSFCIGLIKKEEVYPSITRLEHLRKEVGQIQVKRGMQYRRDMKSIKKQIQRWIDEEIEFLKCTNPHDLFGGINQENKKTPVIAELEKILSFMSVDEMAAKAFVEVKIGLYRYQDHEEAFFSNMVSAYHTSYAKNISKDSFANKFYKPEPTQLIKVKNNYFKGIKFINKYLASRRQSVGVVQPQQPLL
ncbi:hypothetical protein [Desertivirga arenae]|uniref:hypothetical protein n=1 Tax=Desertivirga arenae TaxID=2810309 RepID=UPI001A961CD8|nr:hypothetical protein [Pedobacter sp. SYSU D00823]